MSIRLKDTASLNAESTTKLQTARTINGTSFNGSANITTAQWGTARTITIGNSGKSVNGSGNVSWTLAEIGAVGLTSPAFTGTPTAPTAAAGTNSTQLATTAFVTTAVNNKTSVSGNAGTATKLQTARTINGTNFDGSANITTANWGTTRTLTIGNSGKSVNGSGNVSWTLSEIGALPLSGGTLTGTIYMQKVSGMGQGEFYKNHDASNDLGTVISDKDSSGNIAQLCARALTKKVYAKFATNGGGLTPYELYGEHNVTASATELGYVKGVTSAIQTQLNGKLATTGGTLSGRLTANGKISLPTTAGNYLSGMTLTNAPLAITTQQSQSSYHPVLATKTYSSHVVNMGGIGDSFGFYGYKADRTSNGTDWNFLFNASTGAITTTSSITLNNSEQFIKNTSTGISGHLWAGTGGFVIQSEANANLHLGANNSSNDFTIYGDDSGRRIQMGLETHVSAYTNTNGLRVKNNYIEIYPYSSSYGSGSRLQLFYNANDQKLNMHVRIHSDNSTTGLNMGIGGKFTAGSIETSGLIRSGNIRLNGANTIHNTANGIWINGTSPDYPSYLGTLVVTADSAGGRVHSQAIYNRKFTASANMHINTAYTIGYTSSARKYKLDIMDIEEDQHEKILDLVPKSWFDKTTTEQYAHYLTRRARGDNVSLEDEGIGYLDRVNGLVAEDVEDVGLGNFVNYGDPEEDGKREVLGIQYDRLWTLLIPIARKQRDAIKELKEVVQEQQNQINELKELLQKTA